MAKRSPDQFSANVQVNHAECPPGLALFEWDVAEEQFALHGPLTEKKGAEEGVIWYIHDNRRGIAEKLGVEPWEVSGMAAIYGRILVSKPEIVTFAPIVYEPMPGASDRHLQGYRNGVTVDIDGRLVESGEVKVAELDHIDWMETASRPFTTWTHAPRHDPHSETLNGMSHRAK